MSGIINCAKQGEREDISFISESPQSEVKISKEEYDMMIQNVVDENEIILPEIKKSIQLLNCDLTVKKPDLIGDSKWELILAITM